jgi:hypothetical protein
MDQVEYVDCNGWSSNTNAIFRSIICYCQNKHIHNLIHFVIFRLSMLLVERPYHQADPPQRRKQAFNLRLERVKLRIALRIP